MKAIPEIRTALRSHIIEVPDPIRECSGIRIFGKRIKSILFSTDVAIIKNCNADGVIAVYPFTPQPIITQALVEVSDVPVFCGVGGGITTGKRVINLAMDAEFKGAIGVVVNNPTANLVIEKMRETIDIPIVVTVVSEYEDVEARIKAGAHILNVSAAAQTPKVVRSIRRKFPDFPIMATGGPTDETIRDTIAAGANAITFTPKASSEIFSEIMNKYRNQYEEK